LSDVGKAKKTFNQTRNQNQKQENENMWKWDKTLLSNPWFKEKRLKGNLKILKLRYIKIYGMKLKKLQLVTTEKKGKVSNQ
jgi:hypothetical protein